MLSAMTVGKVEPELVESLMRKWSIVPEALQVMLYASPPVNDSPPFGVSTVMFVWTMVKSASELSDVSTLLEESRACTWTRAVVVERLLTVQANDVAVADTVETMVVGKLEPESV